jgi:tetratricopeptide (TPR) repeat protein
VRQRGLVFLPGGRVLAFAPDRPLRAADLLQAPQRSRPDWQPLPTPPPLAERLYEVRLDLPDPPAEVVLAPGGAGIGEDAPRPGKAGIGDTLSGAGMAGAGKGLAWLAGLLRWKKLADWASKLAKAGMKRAPRLMESLLGRQEAALRELLRQFRAGNLEQALRRALPLGSGMERGGTAAGNANLPWHDTRYSLRSLLQGGGPFSWWLSSAEVQAELAQEYRKAAQAAVQRGDYRRAAFIYGRLLSDFREAAAVLARGGLHHDAALIYLEKVGDRRAAAQQFEAAGHLDRALELYRQSGAHIEAGDLLRRAGDEEAALAEYLLAVESLAADNFVGRGDILQLQARRPDLAVEYYQRGWGQRPGGNCFPCLMRLLHWHAEQAQPAPLVELVGQADAVFGHPGNHKPAGDFYNRLAQLADQPALSAIRDELRDRALCGLADKLRKRVMGGNIDNAVSTLLGQSGAWQAAVVHDAGLAVQAAAPHPRPTVSPSGVSLIHAANGPVTAACHAWASDLVFLGTAEGTVCCFDPRTSRTTDIPPVWGKPCAITALSCSDDGSFLVVLVNYPLSIRRLVSYRKDGERYAVLKEQLHTPTSADCWLTACTGPWGREVVGCWDGSRVQIISVADLVTTGQVEQPQLCRQINDFATQWELLQTSASEPSGAQAPTAAALVHLGTGSMLDTCLLFCGDCLLASDGLPGTGWIRTACGALLQWQAGQPPVQVRFLMPFQLHLVVLDSQGRLHKIQLRWTQKEWRLAQHQTSAAGYLTAAWVRPDHVVAVRPEGIWWLRETGSILAPVAQLRYPVEDVLGCWGSSADAFVICRSGWLVYARRPR